MKREIVKLSAEEQQLVFTWGKSLWQHKEAKKTNKTAIDKKTPHIWLDIMGIGAEYVAAKYIGIPYEFELFDVRDHADLVVGDCVIEVKMNKSKGDDLLKIPKWQIEKPVTRYVLVQKIYKLETWEIIGWIPKEEFLQNMELMTFPGYEKYPMYVVHRSKLHPAEYLKLLSF